MRDIKRENNETQIAYTASIFFANTLLAAVVAGIFIFGKIALEASNGFVDLVSNLR